MSFWRKISLEIRWNELVHSSKEINLHQIFLIVCAKLMSFTHRNPIQFISNRERDPFSPAASPPSSLSFIETIIYFHIFCENFFENEFPCYQERVDFKFSHSTALNFQKRLTRRGGIIYFEIVGSIDAKFLVENSRKSSISIPSECCVLLLRPVAMQKWMIAVTSSLLYRMILHRGWKL